MVKHWSLIFLSCTLFILAFSGNTSQSWKRGCLDKEFKITEKMDYRYEMGILYYYYNDDPYEERGFFPVLTAVRHNSEKDLTAFNFYLAGISDIQIVYILNSDRNIVEKFYQSPYGKCP